jgi:UDP-N-acetylmuramate--alanine ligase
MNARRIHFIGISGIGMSAIARVMAGLGYQISGSDLRETPITLALEKEGITFYKGHLQSQIQNADLVVVSSAIPADNPEVLAARAKKIPVFQRAEMLGFLMKERFGIAVAGTHGKTTTTSMIALILEKAGLDPTVVIGGELNDFGTNAKLGKAQYLVAEADESDASLLHLLPKIAVLTSIDADVNPSSEAFAPCQFDYHKTLKRVEEIFLEFLSRVPKNGNVVLCLDSPFTQKIAPQIDAPVMTYGIEEKADLTARNILLKETKSSFSLLFKGEFLGEIKLAVPGKHNILNALGATGVSLSVGLPFSKIAQALESFHGVKRRFQIVGSPSNVLIVDDYAHNPSKIKATLSAAKSGWNCRVVAVFQPHRYTRTKLLQEEFRHAFLDADLLYVTDIYPAGEVPIAGVNAEKLALEIKKAHPEKKVVFEPKQENLIQLLLKEVKSGDMILTLGAGDIYRIGNRMQEILSKDEQNDQCSARGIRVDSSPSLTMNAKLKTDRPPASERINNQDLEER